MVRFAVNTKAGGKIHRLSGDAKTLPRERQRMRCGWEAKKSTSVVFVCSRVAWGELCMKCFPCKAQRDKEEEPPEELIEEDVEDGSALSNQQEM